MQRVFPVTEQNCREHCGKPVLIFLTDGSEITGMLSRAEGGRLYLNEQSDASDEGQQIDYEPFTPSKKKKVKTKAIKRKKTAGGKKVRTAAANAADPFFGPNPYGAPPAENGGGAYAGPLVFDLSAVAALFVLD